ncbi:hypothetical protein GCM10009665_04240 [Kitasatospora nipponensis]|uniref:Uncharacterized protein n=1 Tax=Kitasatospora nipponensis TaxID=258049 RepID=A0ABP4G8T1_9ACTN
MRSTSTGRAAHPPDYTHDRCRTVPEPTAGPDSDQFGLPNSRPGIFRRPPAGFRKAVPPGHSRPKRLPSDAVHDPTQFPDPKPFNRPEAVYRTTPPNPERSGFPPGIAFRRCR